MAQQDYSTKRRKFQHLTEQKRAQIEILLQMKVPKSRIAREVPVYAGPTEGTALGNLAAQMIASGEVSNLATFRRMIKSSFDIQEYQPKM